MLLSGRQSARGVMGKKDLTEQEIRTQYITPAIQGAGWSPGQIRNEVKITAAEQVSKQFLQALSNRRTGD